MLFPLKKDKYKTLNSIQISPEALLSNFNFFQKINPQAKICPVLKSNAYGHGLRIIGKFVDDKIKPEFICVDSLYEAYELDKENIKTPILIMGYTSPENFKFKKINFRIPVFDEETLKTLNRFQPGIRVHLKIDTGMNRLGIKEDEVDTFIDLLSNYSKIKLEGIYSHLADADNSDEAFSLHQIEVFKKIIQKFENRGYSFKYKHICATSGALQFHDPEFNLIRLGIGFFGLSPFPGNSNLDIKFSRVLKPALKYVSHLCEIKEISKGETVSYARKFKAVKKIKIGILPLGYYDGLDRRFSNNGTVIVGSVNCPIIGRVCMNITIIDISSVLKPYVGQEAVIFSDKASSLNSITRSAERAGTIPYELLANLSETTRRVVVKS